MGTQSHCTHAPRAVNPEQGFLRVSLQLHKWAEDEAPKALRGGVWGGGVPFPTVQGAGKGVPLPRKKNDFGSQYGEFWCILGGIFYSSATCFTRKTGVIWCPLNPFPYFFYARLRKSNG